MADFATKLQRLSERGTPVGVEELIERLEAELAGDPLIVVPKRRKRVVMTKTNERVTSQGPGVRRGLGWAVAAFVAILIMGGLFALLSGDEGEVVNQDTVPVPTTAPAPEPISGAFLLDLGTGEQTPLADLFADAYWATASPDGTTLYANIANTAILANLDGSDERGLIPNGGNGSYYGGRWSPDGTKIVYQSGWIASSDVGDVFVEDPVTGERTQLTDFGRPPGPHWFIAPTFSGDGRHVYFHLARRGSVGFDVWSVPVFGGEPTLVLEQAAQPVSFPEQESLGAFVPTPSDTEGTSIVLNTADGQRTLVETEGGIDAPSASPDGSRIVFGVQRSLGGDTKGIYVVDVSTGESSQVAWGNMASWLDNDTLVVVVHFSVG
jgi:Tol biopolymer transport system component